MSANARISVVCATYRNPEHDNIGRMTGLASTIAQFMDQDYAGKVSLAVLDTSATPHPFAVAAARALPDRFLYLHVPERNNIPQSYKTLYPAAMACIPDDNAMKSPLWQMKASSVEGWSRFVPIEDDFPRPVDIGKQMFSPRPVIGMKKNAGVVALSEAFGEPAQIVFADDDDYHGRTYVSDLVKGRGNTDFTRINRYIVGIDNPKISESQVWGLYDYPFPKDFNGNFFVTEKMKSEKMFCTEVLPDGNLREADPRKWFKRANVLAWSPLSHEGATHSYGYDAWKKGFDAFGGSPACSFGEDVILFRMMKENFGRGFSGQLTDVPEDPMKMNFLRTSDGTNASYLRYNRHDIPAATVPEWAHKSMTDMRAVQQAVKSGIQLDDVMQALGKEYAATGAYEPKAVTARLMQGAGSPPPSSRRNPAP